MVLTSCKFFRRAINSSASPRHRVALLRFHSAFAPPSITKFIPVANADSGDAKYGDTSSISALLGDKGTDGLITLREDVSASILAGLPPEDAARSALALGAVDAAERILANLKSSGDLNG